MRTDLAIIQGESDKAVRDTAEENGWEILSGAVWPVYLPGPEPKTAYFALVAKPVEGDDGEE